jgi:two-component system LytT family response regulator
MKRLTALIIDDERLARVSLRKKLSKFSEIEVIGEASGVTSSIQAINDLNPDILFLDIQLSDGTGFDLLEKIPYNGKVVFVTAFDEHALRAFEVNAIDYLLKPVSDIRLGDLIKNILEGSEDQKYTSIRRFTYDDRIMVEQKGYIHFLMIKDILIINSAKDYSTIVVEGNRKFILLCSMNDWEQKLPKEHFFRAHRSSIINLNKIEKTARIGATAEIYLSGYPKSVRVSRNYYKEMRNRYFYK